MECTLDGITGKGRCCCNCKHQMLAMKHPWNNGEARGRITEVFGSLCAVPDMVSEEGRRQAVFFDGGHGMCEMHEFRAPNAELTGRASAACEGPARSATSTGVLCVENEMDIVEQLRATPETGADPDMIFEAADEIERLRRYIDALHGKGDVRHDYNGMCPDVTQPDSRDDECQACRILTHNAELTGRSAED